MQVFIVLYGSLDAHLSELDAMQAFHISNKIVQYTLKYSPDCKRMLTLSLLSLAATLSLAAASAANETSETSVRIDDPVALDGAILKFNPIDSLIETTRDPEWRHNYLKSALDHEFYEGNELQESHLEKRYSGESICARL
jgi:hypothetical protein